MKQILKRLELIKTSISIEDEEIIELQLVKLKTLSVDDEVQTILEHIEKNNYGEVLYLIDGYFQRFSGITVYEDPKTLGLKLELKVLEQKLQNFSNEKNEYFNNLNAFYVEYNLCLGELIKEVLRLNQLHLKNEYEAKEKVRGAYEVLQKEKEALAQEMKYTDFTSFEEFMQKMHKLQDDYNEMKDEFDEIEELKNAYNEAQDDYENFSSEYEEQLKDAPQELTKEKKKELKLSYRKASKLCHPDIVVDTLKDDAQEMMQELNSAYAKNNLQRVQEILSKLETGKGFVATSDGVDDNEILIAKTTSLRGKIKKVIDEIQEIHEEENYEMMMNSQLWGEYFDTQKGDLEAEVESLQDILKE